MLSKILGKAERASSQLKGSSINSNHLLAFYTAASWCVEEKYLGKSTPTPSNGLLLRTVEVYKLKVFKRCGCAFLELFINLTQNLTSMIKTISTYMKKLLNFGSKDIKISSAQKRTNIMHQALPVLRQDNLI